MPEPFTLSSAQVDELVVMVAQALGLTTDEYPNVTAEQISTWKIAISQRDPTNVSGEAGRFTSIYALVADWTTDNSNPNDPQAITGVDRSAWTFLRAAGNVNQGDSLESFMTREYTKAQYELREGSTATNFLINKMSNGIALNVMKSILVDGTIPEIDEIGEQDAIVVVNEYFHGDQAAWAGNAFFHYFGTNTFFLENLDPGREDGHGTYDIFASMYSMQKGMQAATVAQLGAWWWSDERAFVMAHNEIGTVGTQALMEGLSNTLDEWISSNYYENWSGIFNTYFNPSLFNNSLVAGPYIYMGKLNVDDSLDLRSSPLGLQSIIRAGDHDDTVLMSYLPLLKGIADGGKGIDTLSFSAANERFSITSHASIGGNEAIEISGIQNPGSLYAYNFEKIVLGNGNDKVNLKSAHISHLAELDTGGGNDTIISAPAGTIIHTGEGADTVFVGYNIGIADLSTDDVLMLGDIELHGGHRYKWLENPWAESRGGLIEYGTNQLGELLVKVAGLGTTYLLNYGSAQTPGPKPGDIYVYEYDTGVYQLLDPNKPSHMTQMGMWDLMGALIKTEFGVDAWNRIDPLTLDLDGDGLELTTRSSISPLFDIDGDYYSEKTGWVRPDDGILVRDLNGNGKIDDVTEMFGGSGSGFEALALLDGNADDKIDALDNGLADFDGDGDIDENDTIASLKVWRDLDQDAVTDAGELFSLADLNIVNISLNATEQQNQFNQGNQIAATASFTRADNSTGTIADVWYRVDNINTKYNGDPIEITSQAATLPDHKGFGTLVSLREAMSLDEDFADTVDATLSSLSSLDLDDLREAATPILAGWALASPLGDGDLDPNTNAPRLVPHDDIHILVIDGAFGRDEVIDFAYKTTSTVIENGLPVVIEHWALASGASVKDENDDVIEHPTLVQVLASSQVNGTWSVLDGDLIGFVERYIGESLPLDRIQPEGTGVISDFTGLFTQILTTIDLATVRIATQGGPLSSFFEGIQYDAESNIFYAAEGNDRELIPVFEAIFAEAVSTSANAAWIGEWKPILDIVIGDFVRGEAFLLNTYGFIAQNIVAAYENTGLGLSFADVATALGIPEDILVTGSGTLTGSSDSDIFYSIGANDLLEGGAGPDTYIFGGSIGHDVINDVEAPLSAIPDTLRFAQLTAAEISAARDGLDLVLTVIATGETIRIERQFEGRLPGWSGDGDLSEDTGVGEIIFADGTVWDAIAIAEAVRDPQPTSDTIVGTPSIDFLDGGAGDDHLAGGDDADIYYFGVGYGHDTIEDEQTNVLLSSPDFVQFGPGITTDDVVFHRDGDSDDLEIELVGSDDSLTISGQFSAAYTGPFGQQWFDRIEIFTFDDGNYYTWDQLLEKMVADAKTEGDDTIYGFSYEDLLDGGAGNDFLSGGNENDTYLFGLGYGDDVIRDGMNNILGGQTDTVRFGSGIDLEDLVFTRLGASDDMLVTLPGGSTLTIEGQFEASPSGPFGTIWWHRIERFEFDDDPEVVITWSELLGQILAEAKTEGDDTIYGYFREDVLDGGAGNDYLAGAEEGDTYLWGTGYGNDVIYDFCGALEDIGNGDQVLFSSDLTPDDLVLSRIGNSNDFTFTIAATGETLTVEDQFLKFVTGWIWTEIEEFRFADETVWTPDDIRTLLLERATTAGSDTIYGFHTDDLLDGGVGDDRLEGSGGGDTYIFDAGYGHDVIRDYIGYVTWDQPDKVQFGAGISADGLSLARDDYDLIITVNSTGDQLLIEDHFWSHFRIESFSFADETVWTWEDVQERMLEGTSGDDNLIGFSSADYFDGGAGNDYLEGRGGGDTFRFDLGYGADVINAYIGSVNFDQPDTIIFGAGITAAMLELSRSDYDLVITVTGTGDQLTILDHFYNYNRVENFQFADETVWTWNDIQLALLAGTSGDDVLIGYDTDDILDGGAGDDILKGRSGDDTYVFGRGYGSDTVDDDNLSVIGNAPDRILFGENIVVEDLLFERFGDDLVIRIAGTDDVLTIKHHFNFYFEISNFEFADQTVLTAEDVQEILDTQYMGEATIVGTSADDTLYGTSDADIFDGLAGNDTLAGNVGADTYLHRSGSGNDTINDWTNVTTEVDTVRLLGVTAANVTLLRSGNNLIIERADTGEKVTVNDQFYSSDYGIERILFDDDTEWDRSLITANAVTRGTSGADSLSGSNGPDIFDGLAGNDTLTGNAGADTFLHRSGSGNDTINDWTSVTNEVDTVRLLGVTAANVVLLRSGNNLIIERADTGEKVTVNDQFYSSNYGIERVLFDDGTEWDRSFIAANAVTRGTSGVDSLSGSSGPDIFDGLAGNDTLTGSGGADTFLHRSGSGNDTINDYTGVTTEVDTVRLLGVTAANVVLLRSGNNLIIERADTGEKVTVNDHFYSSNYGIERVLFDDGTEWDRSFIASHVAIRGTSGNDTLSGSNDNDTFIGGLGNDVLNSATGSDTFIYASGDGNDKIDEESGSTSEVDILKFTDLNPSDITLTKSGNDLMVGIAATGHQIELDEQYWSTSSNYGVDQFQFANGTIWNRDQIMQNAWWNGTSGNDSLSGWASYDNIDGGAGNDTINGNAGIDKLIGGAGNDTLTGGTGNDTFIFKTGFGQDIITDFTAGAGSDDVLEFYDGLFADAAAVLAAASSSGNNTIITIDANTTITLQNVALANLHQDDFRIVAG